MPQLVCYTKKGSPHDSELNDAMHLALRADEHIFEPLRNNTGILFPEADYDDGSLPGCTKTLMHPWLFRFSDGKSGVVAVRRNRQKQPDPKSNGCIMVYRSEDWIEYTLIGFLTLADIDVRHPRCVYNTSSSMYRIEWETDQGVMGGFSEDLTTVKDCAPCDFSWQPAQTTDLGDILTGNIIDISEKEAETIRSKLAPVFNTDVYVPEITIESRTSLTVNALPEAICLYNDGSTHQKKVNWDINTLQQIDTSKTGIYKISGEVFQKTYPVPFIEQASDPCIFKYRDQYYFTSSNQQVIIRESKTIDGLRQATPIVIHDDPDASFWAQELHLINDVPYIFTSLCQKDKWYTVQSVILRCVGDIADPGAWSEPKFVLKKDGSMLNQDKGICLDMTYFTIDDIHYVSWSNRNLHPTKYAANENGLNGSADVFIATIDPEKPWQLTSEPVCLCRPLYGWDRIETEVDEGTYLLQHGDDLFMTFSGASVGTVYCVGLLHAKLGSNLLDPASWRELPYPVLTKESVPGQYGPGHNNFVKDPENPEDDLIVLLYRPLPSWNTADHLMHANNPRHSAVRRVHWNASGYPNLEMTPEQDLNPALKQVTLTIRVV